MGLRFGMLMGEWCGIGWKTGSERTVHGFECLAKEFRLHPLDSWGLSKVLIRGSDSQIMIYLGR